MQPSVLLNMRQLFEAAVAVGALIRLFSGMNTYVLNQLMVGRKGFQALLTLMWLHIPPYTTSTSSSASYTSPTTRCAGSASRCAHFIRNANIM